jgi:phosphomannomutase
MSSLKFGTSGLRGLVVDLDGPPAAAYAQAFAMVLRGRGGVAPEILIGRDLRASSPSIAARAAAGVAAAGFTPVDCGALPTPALALAAMRRGAAAIMVTGSHIPDDRNGLKFYRPDGEIDKADEAAITAAHAALPDGGHPGPAPVFAPASFDAMAEYLARYRGFMPPGQLSGLRIGVYEHSSVARDLLLTLLGDLGATVVPLGRAEAFIPVDTEAVREEDQRLAKLWAAEHRLDAIVSTDGDADRPLIADAGGVFLRGDLVGVLAARYLGIGTVVTPVTSNSRIESAGGFHEVVRTRVGSPFVIAGMEAARLRATFGLVGFEANGGLLLGTPVSRGTGHLPALATRDAMLPILAVLASMAGTRQPLRALADALGFAVAASARIEHVTAARSASFLDALRSPGAQRDAFFAPFGGAKALDPTDGLRFTTGRGDIIHFRASGNAPELRIYVEAATDAAAEALLAEALEAATAALPA